MLKWVMKGGISERRKRGSLRIKWLQAGRGTLGRWGISKFCGVTLFIPRNKI